MISLQEITMEDRKNISLRKALALSVVIHEKYGFQSKSGYDFSTTKLNVSSNLDGKGNPIPNSSRLYRQLFPSKNVNESDREKLDINFNHYVKAENIISTLQGFAFKAIERPLTSFEQSVLEIVSRDTINHKELGKVASFPNVYERKLSQEMWEDREAELASTSEWVGELSSRCRFDVVIENLRYLNRTESYLICASESNKNIIKFFLAENKFPDNLVESTKVSIEGYVKKQEISKYHHGKETVLNRIKFV